MDYEANISHFRYWSLTRYVKIKRCKFRSSWIVVTKSHDNPFYVCLLVCFLRYCTLWAKLWSGCAEQYSTPSDLCTTWFVHAIFSFIIFHFLSNLFFHQNHLHYHVIYATKKIPFRKSRWVERFFLADHVWWYCMCTEQYCQMSSLILSSFLQIPCKMIQHPKWYSHYLNVRILGYQLNWNCAD